MLQRMISNFTFYQELVADEIIVLQQLDFYF
jgi:hypothetical protein